MAALQLRIFGPEIIEKDMKPEDYTRKKPEKKGAGGPCSMGGRQR
jgi:hypothetical protein